MNPFTVLNKAIKAVPAVRYALGVARLAAVVDIIFVLRLSPQIAIFGGIIVVAFMFVLLVFAKAASQKDNEYLRGPAQALVWFFTLVVMIVIVLLLSSYFGHWPLSFGKMPDEKPIQSRNETTMQPTLSPSRVDYSTLLDLIRKYLDGHPRRPDIKENNKEPSSSAQGGTIPAPSSTPPTAQSVEDDVFEDLSREVQWAQSLAGECQNLALYRSQQFIAPYKFGPMMGKPLPHTLDSYQLQLVQQDEAGIVDRYRSERARLSEIRNKALVKIKDKNPKFQASDEIKDNSDFQEAKDAAERITPVEDLKLGTVPVCTRFQKLNEYLGTLSGKLNKQM